VFLEHLLLSRHPTQNDAGVESGRAPATGVVLRCFPSSRISSCDHRIFTCLIDGERTYCAYAGGREAWRLRACFPAAWMRPAFRGANKVKLASSHMGQNGGRPRIWGGRARTARRAVAPLRSTSLRQEQRLLTSSIAQEPPGHHNRHI